MNELVIQSQQELNLFKQQIQLYVDSRILPDHIKTPQQAFTIAQMGRELGIPPMESFNSIYVVKGKPSLSAELMMALIYKKHPDAVVNFEELSNVKCVIEAQRNDKHKPTRIEFSIEDAKKAGLASGNTWQKYPRALLRSRAVSEMARTVFPDALVGCSYTAEELGSDHEVERIQTSEQPVDEHRDVSPTQVVTVASQLKTELVDSIIKDQKKLSESFIAEMESIDDTKPGITTIPCSPPNHAQPIIEQAKEKFDIESLSEEQDKLGDFTFTFGKYTDKKLDDISLSELQGWLNWANKQNELKGKVSETRDVVETYLTEYADNHK